MRALDSALDKFPAYSGNLSRSLYFSDEEQMEKFLSQHQVGETVIHDFYTLTTKGKVYNPDGQIQIYIQNATNGKNISSINTKEEEVLYKRGQKFKVMNIRTVEGKIYFLMEEA